MSILDAKDPQSWQIGFEDGVRFACEIVGCLERTRKECDHAWNLLANEIHRFCHKCGKKEKA
jgi:hypothetical protein